MRKKRNQNLTHFVPQIFELRKESDLFVVTPSLIFLIRTTLRTKFQCFWVLRSRKTIQFAWVLSSGWGPASNWHTFLHVGDFEKTPIIYFTEAFSNSHEVFWTPGYGRWSEIFRKFLYLWWVGQSFGYTKRRYGFGMSGVKTYPENSSKRELYIIEVGIFFSLLVAFRF